MVAEQSDENFQFQNGDHGGEKVEMQFSWSDFDAVRNSGRILRTVVRGFGVFPNASTMNFGKFNQICYARPLSIG